jgi:hypothetical protein
MAIKYFISLPGKKKQDITGNGVDVGWEGGNNDKRLDNNHALLLPQEVKKGR